MATNNFKFAQVQNFALSGGGATAGATSIILRSFAQIDGTLLTMTNFGTVGYGTLEPGNGTLEEQISFTGVTQNANGTATLTGIKTVLDVSPYTESSGLAQTHAGATVFVISNTAGFYNKLLAKDTDATISATYTFTVPNYPQVDTSATFPTLNAQLATKAYADSLTFAGAPDATTTQKGIVELATQAEVDAKTATGGTGASLVPTPALNRWVLGSDYVVDTGAANAYVITPSPAITAYATGQIFSFKAVNANTTTSTLNVSALGVKTIKKASGNNLASGDILAGQLVMVEYDGTNFQMMSDVAPDAATQIGIQNNSYIYAADSVGTDAYAITVAPSPFIYTTGQTFYFKAGTANTGAATLAVNNQGPVAIKKALNVALNTGDILSGQIVEATFDGTNFQMMSPQSLLFYGLYASGTTTRDLSTASGVQNIAHGLGTIPKIFTVNSMHAISDLTWNIANSLNGNATSINAASGGSFGASVLTFTAIDSGGGDKQVAVITADATNIILTWTKTGSPTGTANLLWSALA